MVQQRKKEKAGADRLRQKNRRRTRSASPSTANRLPERESPSYERESRKQASMKSFTNETNIK